MRKKVFKTNCKYRYDEERPNRGDGPGRGAKDGGENALVNRCTLRKWGNRRCQYPAESDKRCTIARRGR